MTGAILGWPNLMIKRYVFSVKLKSICNKKGFELQKNGVLWWTGTNKSRNYNFTVNCNNKSFCVKLIGVRSKKILFGFVNEQHYEIKDYTFALPHTMDGFEYKLKKKEPYIFKNNSRPCIVMIPESVKVTVRNRAEQKDRQEIGSQYKAPEGEFYFGENFLEMLKEQ